MKNKIVWIVAAGIVCLAALAFILFPANGLKAEIPSASSHVQAFKDWRVHFSKQMNPDTFTDKTVTVIDSKNKHIPITLEWNESNTILTLKPPKNGYTIDEDYQITISDQVQTAAGKEISDSLTHAFTAVEELPNIKNKKQLVTLLNERRNEQESGVFIEESESAEMSNESADMAASGGDSQSLATSETNVQVAGIDEGDKVKSDGDFIYFAREADILIAATDKQDSKVVSKIEEKDFQPNELYLHNDYLISIGYTYRTIRPADIEKSTNENSNNEIAVLPIHRNLTTAYIYDISDKENPNKIREVTVEGNLTASRKMNGHLYLIANEHPPYQILEESDNPEIRPFIKDTAVSNEGGAVHFDDMYFFPDSEEANFLMLTSINLNDMEKEAKVETYLGASNQMYMSKKHIYIAVNKYKTNKRTSTDKESADTMIARPAAANTEIIQFKIDDGDISYNAKTTVNGTLINQFAMDEQGDTFRIATTKGDMWSEDEPSTNNLYTFDANLNPLGAVEGLAEGERIYSVRFMENMAYMVTFKQVDPLFAIDLKDPKNPTVLGELKIPGFSDYLHPLDDNHLIGFGQNTKLVENEHGPEPLVQMDGLKISLFDVTDPTNPKEKFSEIIGQGHSYSELNHNHKAMYQHPTKNLFGFPAMLFEAKTVHKGDITYEDQQYLFEGALLYNITPENGIKLKDTITHQENNIEYAEWESEIKRIVSVDDLIYTLSYDQMKVYNIKDETIIKTISLPDQSLPY
ncbi:hypothetical protein CIL05_12585 [Virgibacillus profundi]|uniref:SbsA Ig-like domain-containing protein n=1 Tax=Virgibacillus profundi TaxID=2024555 RepID=A0A2A2IC76_9BACI|nr:beta-propeller domain-containing protein [Virgibacillus profundi]PAV29227.1 hypothetical protein CIL05_12585 [Virgibacillus profundi]PXY53396.1 hypothetical protein CIT14_12710 [Virgibacillus profundi]